MKHVDVFICICLHVCFVYLPIIWKMIESALYNSQLWPFVGILNSKFCINLRQSLKSLYVHVHISCIYTRYDRFFFLNWHSMRVCNGILKKYFMNKRNKLKPWMYLRTCIFKCETFVSNLSVLCNSVTCAIL